MTICVYGAASSNIDDIYIAETERLGRELGARRHKLIYGGGASGLMGACARGVAAASGEVIGVVPKFMSAFEALNRDCTEFIETETMSERKDIMESRADAFIIVPGGIGTMDEFFQVLTLEELKRKSAPIILFNINGYYDTLIHFIDDCVKKGFIRVAVKDLFRVCDDPNDALDIIEYFA
ncbi:MAG: TIGR00730 family Rossman fold protein [Eubacterium sp.]|nr:TIGR00730 family Rossman fold protein [Eubacterium sp.]